MPKPERVQQRSVLNGLLDHLAGVSKQCGWDSEAQRFRCAADVPLLRGAWRLPIAEMIRCTRIRLVLRRGRGECISRDART